MNFSKRRWLNTAGVRLWGLFNVPMICWLRPSIIELNKSRAEVKIPLRRRSKNHLNSMYISSLVTGADLACGLLAMESIKAEKAKVSLVFKDLQVNFIKRAEADTHFICEDGELVQKMVKETVLSGERVSQTSIIKAVCPSLNSGEVVAEFHLTLSVKRKS